MLLLQHLQATHQGATWTGQVAPALVSPAQLSQSHVGIVTMYDIKHLCIMHTGMHNARI